MFSLSSLSTLSVIKQTHFLTSLILDPFRFTRPQIYEVSSNTCSESFTHMQKLYHEIHFLLRVQKKKLFYSYRAARMQNPTIPDKNRQNPRKTDKTREKPIQLSNFSSTRGVSPERTISISCIKSAVFLLSSAGMAFRSNELKSSFIRSTLFP